LFKSLLNISHITAKSRVIEIIGGEPLGNSSFNLTKKIIKQIREQMSGSRIVLQSGVYSLKRITEIFPYIDGFSYSIDLSNSPKAINRRNLEKIATLSLEYSVPIQLQTVLNLDDSYSSIKEYLDECDNLNYKWIGLSFPEYTTYTNKELDYQVDIYVNLIKNIAMWKNLKLGGGIIGSVCDYLAGIEYNSCCMCGECTVTIQPDGSITPCYHQEVNNLYSIDEISSAKVLRANHLRNSVCKECDYWCVCHGGCLKGGIFYHDDPQAIDDSFCYVLKKTIDILR